MIYRKVVQVNKLKSRPFFFMTALHLDTNTQNGVKQYHERAVIVNREIRNVKQEIYNV